jgi:dTDP-4-dehydrorhamnose 3,5-epimerase
LALKAVSKHLDGLVVFEPQVYKDDRGFFMESWRKKDLEEHGIDVDFKQDNHSKSSRGVLRGLHFQWDKPLGKLIRITRGAALVVEVDIRPNSPTLGEHIKVELSDENHRVLWVPPGFANGFVAISEICEMQYKCTEYWNPKGEGSILWSDPEIGIDWQAESPILSPKDEAAQTLREWLAREESKTFSI